VKPKRGPAWSQFAPTKQRLVFALVSNVPARTVAQTFPLADANNLLMRLHTGKLQGATALVV
jgi:hypothetical protein